MSSSVLRVQKKEGRQYLWRVEILGHTVLDSTRSKLELRDTQSVRTETAFSLYDPRHLRDFGKSVELAALGKLGETQFREDHELGKLRELRELG